jgi:hypothetical protein
MADELRVMLEFGPKGERVVAVAPARPRAWCEDRLSMTQARV